MTSRLSASGRARCLDVLLALDRDGHGATADELGVYGLLVNQTGRDELDRFVRQTIGPVLDYDARRGGDLERTLLTYFQSDANLARTAARLYVHANTSTSGSSVSPRCSARTGAMATTRCRSTWPSSSRPSCRTRDGLKRPSICWAVALPAGESMEEREPCPVNGRLHEAASGRARGCGGGALPADPLVAPVAHGPEDGYQRPAELAHRILDPRGNLRVDGPDDQLVALQLAKLLGEHLLGHLGDQPAKTAEALRRLLEVPEDERLPLAPDRLERRLHSAVPPAAGNRPHGRSLPSDAARTIPDGARRAPYRPRSMYLTSEWVLRLRAGVGHSWPRRTGRGREPR